MQKLGAFCKKEIVLTVSAVLAVVTSFMVPPDAEYLGYIDFRILAILFSLMAVMAGMAQIGVFRKLAVKMLNRMKTLRQIIAVLVLLCFFSAMFITNDVALITFVPFGILVLNLADRKKDIVQVLVLQTIAANLGSMVTPIGNPQNLYIYTLSGMNILQFFRVMFPYTVVSLIMILLFIGIRPGKKTDGLKLEEKKLEHRKHLMVYVALFVCCILTVLNILPYQVLFVLVLTIMLIMDRTSIRKVDYSLLLTFAFLFVFTGNVSRIGAVQDVLTKLLTGREWEVSLLLSQVISNVPTTILLSGFTDKYTAVMIGADLGGLGTLIGSMASLIAYKFYANEKNAHKGKFVGVLFVYSLIFLIPLTILAHLMI